MFQSRRASERASTRSLLSRPWTRFFVLITFQERAATSTPFYPFFTAFFRYASETRIQNHRRAVSFERAKLSQRLHHREHKKENWIDRCNNRAWPCSVQFTALCFAPRRKWRKVLPYSLLRQFAVYLENIVKISCENRWNENNRVNFFGRLGDIIKRRCSDIWSVYLNFSLRLLHFMLLNGYRTATCWWADYIGLWKCNKSFIKEIIYIRLNK